LLMKENKKKQFSKRNLQGKSNFLPLCSFLQNLTSLFFIARFYLKF
jgi:hypothetical protein